MDFSGLISSLGVYLSGLESFFLAHFGPSSPPFLTQLEALPSTLLESFKALLTGDPTTFFLYITLPILMFSAFRGKGKELDKQDKERKQKESAALADAETLASIKRASEAQARRIDPSFQPKGRMGREQEEGTHR